MTFDRSFLPPAALEFVVLTDTHYMVDPGDAPLEFESRRKQTARVEYALQLAAALDTPFAVHLGDVVQDYPGTALYERALAEARAQFARHGIAVRHAAGNQDIGDKPDPTMPTVSVTSESLAAYHALFGLSWYSFDAAGVHFVVLNSSILNSDLPETAAQQAWLESDLASHDGGQVFLFMHHPTYLFDALEPALGHYDNLAQPARSWLLGLLRQHRVELLLSGHSHFAWFDRIDFAGGANGADAAGSGDQSGASEGAPVRGTRYFICVSTSFTRPGFSELFSSPPPNEHGRDDTGKLGFYLVRVQPDGTRVHFIRTGGVEARAVSAHSAAGLSAQAYSGSESERRRSAGASTTEGANDTRRKAGGCRRLLTRLSRDLPDSPLGVVLSHPLANVVDVPLAWPSVIRQRVRNDYPFLSLVELGARHVRLPATDLDDALQRRRLVLLRDEGLDVSATWLWHDQFDLPAAMASHRDLVSTVEVHFPGDLWPSDACLRQIERCAAESGVPVALAPVIPKEPVPGKQHLRTRIGYRVAELPELNRRLAAAGRRIDRVLCRIDLAASPWDVVLEYLALPLLPQIGAVDWIVALPPIDAPQHTARAAEALFAAALVDGGRLFLEPFIDLDRTMDVNHGLLDRLCNPRPAFHAVRYLNTILFSSPTPSRARSPGALAQTPNARVLGLQRSEGTYWLRLPVGETRESPVAGPEAVELELRLEPISASSGASAACYRLGTELALG